MRVMLDDERNEMTIKVPLGQGIPSRSGNTTVVASTRGNQLIGEWKNKTIYLQLNVLATDRDIQTTGKDGQPLAGVVEMIDGVNLKKPAGRVARVGRPRKNVA